MIPQALHCRWDGHFWAQIVQLTEHVGTPHALFVQPPECSGHLIAVTMETVDPGGPTNKAYRSRPSPVLHLNTDFKSFAASDF